MCKGQTLNNYEIVKGKHFNIVKVLLFDFSKF